MSRRRVRLRRERDEALEARDDAIRERDEARAGCSTMGQWLDVVLIQRRDVRAERDRYREALERIAKGRGDAMRPDALAADESMMIAREALGGSDA